MSNGTYPSDGWNWVSNVFSCLKEEENKALPNSSAGSGCSPTAAAAAGKEEAVTYLGSGRLECHTLALPGSDLAAQVARRRPNIAQVTCCIPPLSPPGPPLSACPPDVPATREPPRPSFRISCRRTVVWVYDLVLFPSYAYSDL